MPRQTTAVDTAALAEAIRDHIAGAATSAERMARFAEFTTATSVASKMRTLLKAVAADRVISGGTGPSISRDMVESVTAGGAAGSMTRDLLFFDVTARLDGVDLRNGQ